MTSLAALVNLSSLVDRCRPGDVLHVHPSRVGEISLRSDVEVKFDLRRDLFRVTRNG